MLLRLFSATIVVFWLAMTGLLLQRVYFAGEERYPEVDPDYVLELFLRQPETAQLYLFKDQACIGDSTFATRRFDKDKVDIRFTTAVDAALPGVEEQTLTWGGSIVLGKEREIERLSFDVRFQKPEMTVRLKIDPETNDVSYTVVQRGVVVRDSEAEDDPIGLAQVKFLLATWGMDSASLTKRGQDSAPFLEARHGPVEFFGRRFHSYIVTMNLTKQQPIKLYLTEAGELMKVSTELGYTLMSEVFVSPEVISVRYD